MECCKTTRIAASSPWSWNLGHQLLSRRGGEDFRHSTTSAYDLSQSISIVSLSESMNLRTHSEGTKWQIVYNPWCMKKYARAKCYPSVVISQNMPTSCLCIGDILPNGLKKTQILFIFRQNVSRIGKPDEVAIGVRAGGWGAAAPHNCGNVRNFSGKTLLIRATEKTL